MQVDYENIDTWLQSLTDVAFQRYQAGDTTGMVNVIPRLDSLHRYYTDDTTKSAIETALMNCILMLAESYATALEFEEALNQCKSVLSLLEENRARFVSQGNNPRPNSLVWCELLGTMALIKWKAPDRFRDAVIPPDLMIQKYTESDTRIRQAIEDTPYSDNTKNQRATDQALGCGVEIAKLACRYFPEELPMIVDFINSNHGGVLEDTKQPYHWDLKIAQTWCDKIPNLEILQDCFLNFENTMETLWEGDSYLSVFYNYFQTEKNYLLLNIRKEKMLVNPAKRDLQLLH